VKYLLKPEAPRPLGQGMRRTYRVPARVDDVDANVRAIFSEIGTPYANALNQAGTIEAVLNAIIHGIFRVASGPERDPIAFLDAIRAAECAHTEDDVRVTVDHTPGSSLCTIVVSDPGDGFDTAAAMKKLDSLDPLAPSGRGLLMMCAAAERVAWNPTGNEVTLRFRAPTEPDGHGSARYL
jgi:Histidine kinase-like ATPase domain